MRGTKSRTRCFEQAFLSLVRRHAKLANDQRHLIISRCILNVRFESLFTSCYVDTKVTLSWFFHPKIPPDVVRDSLYLLFPFSSSPSPLLLLLFPFFSSPSSLPHSRDCHTLPSSVNLLIIISITSPTFASLSRSHRSLQHKQQTARKSTSPRPVLNAYTFTLNRSLLIDPQLPIVHIYSLPLSSSPIALDHSALGLAATPIVAVAQHAVQQSPPNCFRRCRLPTSRLQLAHQQESLQPWACSAPFCTRRSLALPF